MAYLPWHGQTSVQVLAAEEALYVVHDLLLELFLQDYFSPVRLLDLDPEVVALLPALIVEEEDLLMQLCLPCARSLQKRLTRRGVMVHKKVYRHCAGAQPLCCVLYKFLSRCLVKFYTWNIRIQCSTRTYCPVRELRQVAPRETYGQRTSQSNFSTANFQSSKISPGGWPSRSSLRAVAA